jgi:hypothetical protein
MEIKKNGEPLLPELKLNIIYYEKHTFLMPMDQCLAF